MIIGPSKHEPIGAHIAAALPKRNGQPFIWRDRKLHSWEGRCYLSTDPMMFSVGWMLLKEKVRNGEYRPADWADEDGALVD